MAMLTVRAWSSASRHPPPLPGAPAAEVEPLPVLGPWPGACSARLVGYAGYPVGLRR